MEELIMEDLAAILSEILDELRQINSNLSDLKGSGLNSVDDICNKLESLEDVVNGIKGPVGYDLTDIHGVLNNIDLNTSGL